MSMLTEFKALVNPLVGNRVYPQAAPDTVVHPYIVYFRVANTEENTLATNGGVGNLENTRLQVDVWSDKYLEAQTIAGQVKAAMKGWATSNIKTLEQDDYEPDTKLHRVILEFSVRHA